MTALWFGLGGAIFGLLGLLHAIFTLADTRRPRRLHFAQRYRTVARDLPGTGQSARMAAATLPCAPMRPLQPRISIRRDGAD